MKISIITISYNQAQFLEQAICSVINQDYPDIEYIVVDPGSTDGSREIIEKYRDRIDEIIFEPDEGPADGLNKGFSHATGEIFAYINADDLFLPGAVSSAVKAFTSKPYADVIIGHGYIVDTKGKVIRRFRSASFSIWRFAYGASTVIQQSTFLRRSAFLAAAGFNVDNRTSWDAELLLQMGLNGAIIKIVNEYWSMFTIHPASISGSQRMAEESLLNHRRYFKMVMGRDRKPIDEIWQRFAWLQRWLLDPVGAIQHLSDNLFGPPQIVSHRRINQE